MFVCYVSLSHGVCLCYFSVCHVYMYSYVSLCHGVCLCYMYVCVPGMSFHLCVSLVRRYGLYKELLMSSS